MKKLLLALCVLFTCVSVLDAQVLYTNTTETGNRFNPGLGQSGTPKVTLDDILIPSTQVAGSDSIRVTRVKVGVRRLANAPAVSVNFYFSLVDDTATLTNNLPTIPPVLLGTVNLPANGATAVTQVVSLGDSVNTLFRVKTDTGNLVTGFQAFFMGASLSTNDANNGLRIVSATNPNANVFWIYNADSTVKRNASSFASPTPSVFYWEVFGYPVGGTIPVKLVKFAGSLQNNNAILNWSTETEVNNTGFNIERSIDGTTYNTVGFVAGAGNSTSLRNYNFTDRNIPTGIVYYRLNQIDLDGKTTYSNIIKLNNEASTNFTVTVVNPSKSKVDLQLFTSTGKKVSLNLYGMNGQLIMSKQADLTAGTTSLSIGEKLSKGSYVLNIISDGEKLTKQVIVD